MVEINRYDPDGYNGMMEAEDGSYIDYIDYERLEEENAELRRVINELKENER